MTNRIAAIVSAAALALMLSACDTTSVPGLDFTPDDQKGTLVVGMVSSDDTKISLIVAPLNEDGTVSARGGQTIQHTSGKNKEFYTLSLKPGRYVFRSMNWKNRLSKYVVCLNTDTYAFSIDMGRTIYAGDIAFERSGFGSGAVSFTGLSDRTLVTELVSGDPKIQGSLEDAQLRPTTFSMGRNRLTNDELCGSGSF